MYKKLSLIIFILLISFAFAETKSPEKVIINSIGMEFVLIPGGEFMMGSKLNPQEIASKYGGYADLYKVEHPQHNITLSEPIYLQTTEVTQGQWKKVMGANPSYFKDCGDTCPVERVSWDEAHDFIKKLNDMEGEGNYRLPSESEWEYACRSESNTEFFFGDDAGKLGEYVWYSENSGRKTHPVGQKKPNAWGLYDMYGNVYEWVEDDWHGRYDGAADDGSAWIYQPRGSARDIRGGGWVSDAFFCRSAGRRRARPNYRLSMIGFRLARSVALGS